MDYNNDTYGGSLNAKITFQVIAIEGTLELKYSDAKKNTIEDSTVEVQNHEHSPALEPSLTISN